MRMIIGLLLALVAFNSFAGFEGLSSGDSLGIFNRINCSTGLTCTKVGSKLNMVSSPSLTGPLTLESAEVLSNTVDDIVQIASNDEHTTFSILGFEAKDAVLFLYSDQGDDNADKFSIKASAADVLSFNNNGTAFLSFSSAGAATMTGSLAGDGGDALVGFLHSQVAATATTITAAQCGSTFYNSGAIEIELPEASTVVGCRLSFVTLNAANFDIDPDAADQILVLTDAAGDKIRNATLGNSVTIQAVSASQWVVVGEKGTWSDAN